MSVVPAQDSLNVNSPGDAQTLQQATVSSGSLRNHNQPPIAKSGSLFVCLVRY